MALAFITCHFNPQRYERARRKFQRFRECMGNVDLFTVEISYNGEWDTDAVCRIEAKENQLLWQKERALNYLIDRLPDNYDMVSWIDADLIPLGPRWADNIEIALANFPVIQPWARIHFLDKDGRIYDTLPSYAYAPTMKPRPHTAAPGGWWAARREALADGLLDFNPVGACDYLQAQAWRGAWNHRLTLSVLTPGELALYERLARAAYARSQGAIGYCNGDVAHIFHGETKDRQYRVRHDWIAEAGFDPARDLRLAPNGLYEWTPAASPLLVERIKQYFALRREDA